MGPPRLKLSYHLRDDLKDSRVGHCFGVNALQVSSRRRLYSAGRDAVIQCWDTTNVAEGHATHLRSFEHHTHWVNDIALCTENSLASCSSDTSVKLWRVGPEMEEASDGSAEDGWERGLLATFEAHTDFVKCLSFAPESKVLASGGLDNRVCIWDLAHSCSPLASLRDVSSAQSCECSGRGGKEGFTWHQDRIQKGPALKFTKASIYSLVLSQGGNLALCSGPDRVVSGWDVRASRACFKLKGHQDIVRKLLIKPDCSKVVSASSDCTLKVWDLGQQRCLETVEVHDDSVWTLAWDSANKRVFSGGRDKAVWCTDLATLESHLVAAKLPGPVLSLALSSDESGLWISTDCPEIQLLSLNGVGAGECRPDRMLELPGRAGIVQHHILNNRRQVLSCDTKGTVLLWDVTGVEPTQNLGKMDWDMAVQSLSTQQSIPSWFSIDTTLGILAVRLDESQCFDAIMYPATACLESYQVTTINLGERVIECLFRTWKEKKMAAVERARNQAKQKVEEDAGSKLAVVDSSSPETALPTEKDDNKSSTESSSNENVPLSDPPPSHKPSPTPKVEPMMPTLSLPANTPVIISDAETGAAAMRTTIGGFTETDILPPWIADCVLRGSYSSRLPSNVQKITFIIKPKKGEDFPKKISNTISGMRWYHARKIHEHIVKAMGISLPMVRSGEEEVQVLPEDYLELECNGQVLDPTMDLAAVKAFVWKSYGDISVEYRVAPSFRKPTTTGAAQK